MISYKNIHFVKQIDIRCKYYVAILYMHTLKLSGEYIIGMVGRERLRCVEPLVPGMQE
jgi:hypothetical protein